VVLQEEIPRVPIVCTGNDFSTLYAPLIRDGRMEKFYWAPTREDRVGVCMGIFQHDNVDRAAVEQLVDTFPGQSIDFFGALRARVYDDKVDLALPSVSKKSELGSLLESIGCLCLDRFVAHTLHGASACVCLRGRACVYVSLQEEVQQFLTTSLCEYVPSSAQGHVPCRFVTSSLASALRMWASASSTARRARLSSRSQP
jgi:hypothetical protein